MTKYFLLALGFVFGAAATVAWRSEDPLEDYQTDGFFFPMPQTKEQARQWSRERIVRLINEQLDRAEWS